MNLDNFGILIPIFENTESSYVKEPIIFAAQELKEFVYKSTGKYLPIVNFSNGERNYISLGKTSLYFKEKFDVDYKQLGEDGFFIKEEQGNIYFDGNSGAAVLYAVYDFLEVYLGVKFISADTTIIPKHSTVIDEIIDRKEIPACNYRSYLSGDCYDSWADYSFMARSRTHNQCTEMPLKYGKRHWIVGRRDNNTHNMNYYIPAEYRKTHPEFFYTREGVTEVLGWADDGTGNSQNVTVCLTNGISY